MFSKLYAKVIENVVNQKTHVDAYLQDLEKNQYWRRLILYAYVAEDGFTQDQINIGLKRLVGLPPELDYIYSKRKIYMKNAEKWLEFYGFIKPRVFRKPKLINKKYAQDAHEMISEYEKVMLKNLMNKKWVEYDDLTGSLIISGKEKKLQIKSVNKAFMDYLWRNQNQRLSYKNIERNIKFKGAKFSPAKYIKEIGIEKFIEQPDKGVLIFKAPAIPDYASMLKKFNNKKVTK